MTKNPQEVTTTEEEQEQQNRAGESIAAAASASDKPAAHPQAVTQPGARGGFGPPADPSLNVGVIGNCSFSALIDARGRVVWSCLPRFDGEPVFNALLHTGEDASAWAIEIEDFASSKQWYERNTAVLRGVTVVMKSGSPPAI